MELYLNIVKKKVQTFYILTRPASPAFGNKPEGASLLPKKRQHKNINNMGQYNGQTSKRRRPLLSRNM